jgi:hypothetical protein
MMTGITALPPKMAVQYAERAKRKDGCVRVGSEFYEWAQGNNAICLIHLDPPMGHFGKDARRAAEIRAELEAAKARIPDIQIKGAA